MLVHYGTFGVLLLLFFFFAELLLLWTSQPIPRYKYNDSHLLTYPDLNFPLNWTLLVNLWWGLVYSFLKYPLKKKFTYLFIDTRTRNQCSHDCSKVLTRTHSRPNTRTWNLFVLKHRECKKSLQGGFISDVKARNQLVHLYIYPRASNLKSYQHQNIKLIRYETY